MKGLLIQEKTPTPDSPSEIKWCMVDGNADNYITKLEQEIKRLSTEKEQLNSLVNSCQDEIRRLNNIINSLEKLLEYRYEEYKDTENDEIRATSIECKNLLDYLKKLKRHKQ